MATIPKLAWPFDVVDGRVRVVEQGSANEVAQCVYAVLATQPGDRTERPGFGFPSQLFRQGGVDLDELRAAVENWEPRASVLTEAQFEGLTENVRVSIT